MSHPQPTPLPFEGARSSPAPIATGEARPRVRRSVRALALRLRGHTDAEVIRAAADAEAEAVRAEIRIAALENRIEALRRRLETHEGGQG